CPEAPVRSPVERRSELDLGSLHRLRWEPAAGDASHPGQTDPRLKSETRLQRDAVAAGAQLEAVAPVEVPVANQTSHGGALGPVEAIRGWKDGVELGSDLR